MGGNNCSQPDVLAKLAKANAGYYTFEQEADEVALQILALTGVPSTALERYYSSFQQRTVIQVVKNGQANKLGQWFLFWTIMAIHITTLVSAYAM